VPKILFDIGHPAEVHLFKNPCRVLQNRGWKVLILARDKEVTRSLLEDYGIEYFPGTKKSSGLLPNIKELIDWMAVARNIIRTNTIDIVASAGSPAGAWAAKISGIPHICFNDTETAGSQRLLYKPASVRVYSPACLLVNYGPKHVHYNGTHDLAYLRPEWFTPDVRVRHELGLTDNDHYVILRFVSWEASHDWGERSTTIDFKRQLASIALKKHHLFISAEGPLPPDLEKYRLAIRPSRLLDAIAFASAVVGDGSTTMTEAAALGTPALYVSTFAGSLGYLRFFENYGLLVSTRSEEHALKIFQDILENPRADFRKAQRDKMIQETIDVATYIANICEIEYRKFRT